MIKKDYKEGEKIRRAAEKLSVSVLADYFKNEDYPVHGFRMDKNGQTIEVNVMKIIEENLKSSKDIKNMFEEVFDKNENTFYDLVAPISFEKSLNRKIKDVIKSETGYDLIEDVDCFRYKDSLEGYQKMYVYLDKLREDLPENGRKIISNVYEKESIEEQKEAKLQEKIKDFLGIDKLKNRSKNKIR